MYLGFNGGDVGLAITQAAALTGLVQWGLRQSAEVANQAMSVERVLEYTKLPDEPQPLVPKNPPDSWPSNGRLVFNRMGLKYSDDGALVLKNLDLVIQPKEKVGSLTSSHIRIQLQTVFVCDYLGRNRW